MEQSVAFIGLGAMGYRMAAHLPNQFKDVRVWNRSFEKAEAHAAQYATRAVSLQDALQADFIFSCLPTSQEVESIVYANDIKSGAIWIDCTSGVPESAKALAAYLKTKDVAFLDAPVSGQTIGAENATLTFMIGGSHEAFERAQVPIQCMGKLIQYVGESGAGFTVKAVNNTLLAAHLWAAAESFSVLKEQGVDLNAALACINASSGKSGVTENILAQRILNRSFPKTFALGLLAKDTGIATDLAREHRLPVPLLALTQQFIQAAHVSDQNESDFSAAVKLYEHMSNIKLEQ